MKSKKRRTGYGLLLWGLILCTDAVPSSGYEQWQQQQLQHDARLQRQVMQQANVVLPTPKNEVTTQKNTALSIAQTSPTALGVGVTVNINRASAQEISAKLDSIGHKKAQAIVGYRSEHGDFKRIDDLKNVKGIGEKTFARNKERLKLKD